ncbi:hypothetical protein [Glaciibacter sp. 2TAF33]|uniref:hypothetical protein n=1 Tax=Glaciibacter sp. 2TAF33 TaxID=3233015 RepID=UPI003F9164E2
MTAGIRSVEIIDYDFDVPADFYPVQLDAAEDIDSTRWALGVVDDVALNAPASGDVGDIALQLAELRTRLLGQQNPWLSAVVSVRPEKYLTIGALLMVQQLAMDEDDGPDGFEQLARQESERMRPGARSRDLVIWRDEIPAGEVVGLYQRVEFTAPGQPEGRLSERTMFGVFPPGSTDMLQFTFTCDDFGAFGDMRAESQAIVATLSVKTAALDGGTVTGAL